jgi:hypothetical protein
MLDHTFEEPEEEREREFVDAAAERAEGLHDFDPLFTLSEGAANGSDAPTARASTTHPSWISGASLNTLRIPREQALTRPVLTAKPPATLAPGVTREEEERAA